MKNIIMFLMMMVISTTVFAGFNICDDGGLVKRGSSPIVGCLYFNDDNISEYNRVKTLFSGVRHDFLEIVGGVVVEKSQAEKDIILTAEALAQSVAEAEAKNNLQVTIKQAFTAWLTVYNSKVPLQYQVTANEITSEL